MTLKARQRFGKYIIEGKLGEGGFAVVYRALDTIEGVRVALKIPYSHWMTGDALGAFRQEVRLVAKLEHPHIQPLKYADFVDGQFVIVTALGLGSLEERLRKRLSVQTALDYSAQLLSALAFAHEQHIIHCDVKPDNVLLFPDNQLRLTDFGIARMATKTLQGSGAGTLGYVAPEQAMGKPSFRSDVFSMGIVMHRLLTGHLPEWPYDWPFPGFERLRANLHADLIAVLKKACDLEARRRYKDACQMLVAFERAKHLRKKSAGTVVSRRVGGERPTSWKKVRFREFQRDYGKLLETKHACRKCDGPVAETMKYCPWCADSRKQHRDEATRFTVACPRCRRGLKSDWTYCPWCFGPGFEPETQRKLNDKRYQGRCANAACTRKVLMPFMNYCPWCRARVKKPWRIDGSKACCDGCGWGVLRDYWSVCPWCGRSL